MVDNPNTHERRILPELGEEYRRDISARKGVALGIALAIFGNLLVNSIFELIKNRSGGSISNETLWIILGFSFCIVLFPIYFIFQDLILIKRQGKWGVSIVASGTQSYMIGDSFGISGTCLSNNQFVKIRVFEEKPPKKRIYETYVQIEKDFQFHSSINTTGYESGIYSIFAENDNGTSASVSVILNDKKLV